MSQTSPHGGRCISAERQTKECMNSWLTGSFPGTLSDPLMTLSSDHFLFSSSNVFRSSDLRARVSSRLYPVGLKNNPEAWKKNRSERSHRICTRRSKGFNVWSLWWLRGQNAPQQTPSLWSSSRNEGTRLFFQHRIWCSLFLQWVALSRVNCVSLRMSKYHRNTKHSSTGTAAFWTRCLQKTFNWGLSAWSLLVLYMHAFPPGTPDFFCLKFTSFLSFSVRNLDWIVIVRQSVWGSQHVRYNRFIKTWTRHIWFPHNIHMTWYEHQVKFWQLSVQLHPLSLPCSGSTA